jgi:GTP-binding protein
VGQRFEYFSTVNHRYSSLIFLTGAASMRGLPPDLGYEVAFAGRSNAGKSSALNAVAARRALARTSKTPGRTQQINFFELDERRRLADLPGYGFAKAPADVQRRWTVLVESYLQRRECLSGLVLLMDSRRPLTELDQQMVQWCVDAGVNLHAVLTKSDKLGRGAAMRALAEAQRTLQPLGDAVSVQLFSATKRTGLDELRAKIDAWLRIGVADEKLDESLGEGHESAVDES